jgi:hypothetical protein
VAATTVGPVGGVCEATKVRFRTSVPPPELLRQDPPVPHTGGSVALRERCGSDVTVARRLWWQRVYQLLGAENAGQLVSIHGTSAAERVQISVAVATVLPVASAMTTFWVAAVASVATDVSGVTTKPS